MIKIRKFKNQDVLPVCDLILKTFKKYNLNGPNPKRLELYLNCYSPKRNSREKLLKYFSGFPINFVALDGTKVVGTSRGRAERLTNLYVDGHYHRQGIGRRLLQAFEKEAKKMGSKKIKIRASLFAEKFYLKQGYKRSTGKRNFKYLKVQPMFKKI